jgi:hypothetical protein
MKKQILVLLCIMYCRCSGAETDSIRSSVVGTFTSDFSAAGANADYIFGEIGSLSMKSAVIVAGASAGTYSIATEDRYFRTQVTASHTETSDKLWNIAKEYGGTYSILGVAGSLYIGGLVVGSEEVRTTGRLVAEGLIVSGVTNGILKFTFGRARPYLNTGNENFQWFETSNDYASLPSGHTTVAFTISTVLAERINRWWASIPLYGLAAATGYSRMYHDQHWASDVFLGAVIGYFSGKAITAAEEYRQKKSRTQGEALRIYPTIGGIGLAYKF